MASWKDSVIGDTFNSGMQRYGLPEVAASPEGAVGERCVFHQEVGGTGRWYMGSNSFGKKSLNL